MRLQKWNQKRKCKTQILNIDIVLMNKNWWLNHLSFISIHFLIFECLAVSSCIWYVRRFLWSMFPNFKDPDKLHKGTRLKEPQLQSLKAFSGYRLTVFSTIMLCMVKLSTTPCTCTPSPSLSAGNWKLVNVSWLDSATRRNTWQQDERTCLTDTNACKYLLASHKVQQNVS